MVLGLRLDGNREPNWMMVWLSVYEEAMVSVSSPRLHARICMARRVSSRSLATKVRCSIPCSHSVGTVVQHGGADDQ